MSLSNVSLVAFHYRSYGTFCIYSKKLHNLHGGFTHYRNYRAWKNSQRLTLAILSLEYSHLALFASEYGLAYGHIVVQ